MMIAGLALLVLALWLATPTPVEAQCGASSSSCKNCHEVNARHPVNGSGEWHTSHAFGDFCAFCHAGNVQAIDQDAAHLGMIYPLNDPKSSCATCHPADYMEQAGVYAVALGVDLTTTDSGSAGDSGAGSGGSGAAADAPLAPIPPPGERNASGALVDYNRRYEIEVLGHADTSRTGNLILAVLALGMTGLGVFLVWRFERVGEAFRKAAALPTNDWRRDIEKYMPQGGK
ncbi:MAG: hypothetical protein IT323_18460 [Anaerolineae bacterium]|nr:hypothetical protein [Anaerolineae bacterium]